MGSKRAPTQGSRVPQGKGSCPIRMQLRRLSQVSLPPFVIYRTKTVTWTERGRRLHAFLLRAPSWMLFIARKRLKRSHGAQTLVEEQRYSHAVRSLCLSEIPSAVLLLATPAGQASSLISEGVHTCASTQSLFHVHIMSHIKGGTSLVSDIPKAWSLRTDGCVVVHAVKEE